VFGIVQGGTDPTLREECARTLVSLGFDGHAIGGVSVGEPEAEISGRSSSPNPFSLWTGPVTRWAWARPRRWSELVARGVDMFDCVLPTRVARNGTAFTRRGTFAIKGGAVKSRPGTHRGRLRLLCLPPFLRAYLRHLLT